MPFELGAQDVLRARHLGLRVQVAGGASQLVIERVLMLYGFSGNTSGQNVFTPAGPSIPIAVDFSSRFASFTGSLGLAALAVSALSDLTVYGYDQNPQGATYTPRVMAAIWALGLDTDESTLVKPFLDAQIEVYRNAVTG